MAEIIPALCELARNSETSAAELRDFFRPEMLGELQLVLSKIFEAKYYKGSGGEYMRPAVCFFIQKISLSKLFESNSSSISLEPSFINECEVFLRQCIEYNKDTIQMSAIEALPFFCDLKFIDRSSKETSLVKTYLEELKQTSKEFVRSGYCLAVSNFPRYLLRMEGNYKLVMRVLIESSRCFSGPIRKDTQPVLTEPSAKGPIPVKNADTAGWVQARRDSIKALTNLLSQIKLKEDLEKLGIDDRNLIECFECFLNGLDDYSIDSKGDSGSKIREASIEALESLSILCAKLELKNILSNTELITKVLAGIVQQGVERIDRTRNIAGKTFYSLIYNKHLKLDNLNFINDIRTIFKKHECYYMDWHVAQTTLPLFIKLVHIKEFQMSVITGFVFSIGSLTESLVKSATSSFLKEFTTMSSNNVEQFVQVVEIILQLCSKNLKNDRLSSSLIKTVDLMIQNNLLSQETVRAKNLPVAFLNTFLENVKLTRDMQKLISYVDLFCDFLQFEEDKIRERSMVQLMIMLCHQFPRIRKTAASKLFEALINYSEIFESEAENDDCITLLTETDWDQSVEIIRPIRNRICDLTKTPKPILSKKN